MQFPLLFFRLTECSFAVNAKTLTCTFFSLSLRNFRDFTTWTIICYYFKVKELENQLHTLQQAKPTSKLFKQEKAELSLSSSKHLGKDVPSRNAQLISSKDKKPKKNEEQNIPPTAERKSQVNEEVVENGLAAEVLQALTNFQLSWDTEADEVETGTVYH